MSMDETREILYQRRLQRERGEYPIEDGTQLEEMLIGRASAIRCFYLALVREGFSEEDALKIIISAPV